MNTKRQLSGQEKFEQLRDGLKYLMERKAYVSGMVISASPDPYVLVRDLRALLKRVEE